MYLWSLFRYVFLLFELFETQHIELVGLGNVFQKFVFSKICFLLIFVLYSVREKRKKFCIHKTIIIIFPFFFYSKLTSSDSMLNAKVPDGSLELSTVVCGWYLDGRLSGRMRSFSLFPDENKTIGSIL